jgi:hypothetical protein
MIDAASSPANFSGPQQRAIDRQPQAVLATLPPSSQTRPPQAEERLTTYGQLAPNPTAGLTPPLQAHKPHPTPWRVPTLPGAVEPTPQPVPSDFALGPGRGAMLGDAFEQDRAAILQALTSGRPFAADVDQCLLKMTGQRLTAGGIEALFTPLLPSAAWIVSGANLCGPGMQFVVSAVDRLGKVVFDVGACLCAYSDGSLEAFSFSGDVTPEHRGLGLTAHGEKMITAILRALSAHTNTHMALRAGSMEDVNTGAAQSGNGALVHAARGYLFADSCGVDSPYSDGSVGDLQDPQAPLCDRALCARHFVDWLQKDPTVQVRSRPLSPADLAELTLAASHCTTPIEFLRLGGSDATAQARLPDGTLAPMPLGKAFFLSSRAPIWCGVRFINPPDHTVLPEDQRLRTLSQNIFADQLQRELRRASERAAVLEQQVYQQFCSASAAERRSSYLAIGLHGHPATLRYLQERLAGTSSHVGTEPNPQARLALQQALSLTAGSIRRSALRQAAADAARPQWVRDAMAERLENLAA